MLLLGERPQYVDQLTERLTKLSGKLFEALPPGQPVVLKRTNDLYALEPSDRLFIVRSGNLYGHYDNRLCVYFESEDLIGLSQCYQLPSLRIAIEDSAEVQQYEADLILRFVNDTKERQAIWTSYLITLITLFQDAFGRNHRQVAQPNTGFLHFAAGQNIINQGDEAQEVFSILNGKAEVFVDDIRVGAVLADEIFGEMAVFTGEKRSATVRAETDCTVLAVPQADFISLIQSHPQTTMTLIENMARSIKTLNGQLTQSHVTRS